MVHCLVFCTDVPGFQCTPLPLVLLQAVFHGSAHLANIHVCAQTTRDSVNHTSSLLQGYVVLQPHQRLSKCAVGPEGCANPEWGQCPSDGLR